MNYLDKLLSLKDTIGNTPIVKMVFVYNGKTKTVFAKEEFLNPSGSIKIRPAFRILKDAIESGLLKEGQRVVEVTSGNMGIALTYLCKKIGNQITILMPKGMSEERKNILRELGADIVLTNDFLDAFNKEQEYQNKGAFLTKQFDNKSNVLSHEETAREIIDKNICFDGFVSGVGTGGTLIGCGGFLKETLNKKLIAVDPAESSLLLKGTSQGKHKIQGLSDQIIPSLYKSDLVDEIIEINSDDAIVMARKINEFFGIGVGISSGANVLGAVLSKCDSCATVFADDNKRYLSTDLSNENITSDLVKNIKFISVEVI